MAEPIRMTDDDVLILMRHGKDSEEGKAALSRLVKRLADSIDDRIAEEVYGKLRENIERSYTSSQAGDHS